MHVLGGERLHQAADGEVGHWEARRLAADKQAWNAKVIEPHRNRKAGRTMGEMKIEEDEVRVAGFSGGDGTVGIFGHRHDTITRIVLDQIFERYRQLAVIFDDQDFEHSATLPTLMRNPPENP